MRNKITIVLLVICTILLSGCIQRIESPTAAVTDELATSTAMNVCYINGAASHVALLYAFEKGIFQKYGLSVELTAMRSGSTASAAMIANELDICLMSGSSVINGVAAGADPVIIGGLFNSHIYSLIVTAEIESAEQLKGNVLAINRASGTTDIVMRAALQHLGLQADTDLQLLTVGGQSERIAAMTAGQVVGTVATVPESVRAIEKGFHELLDISTLNLPTAYVTVATRRSYLETHRDSALRFMQAVTEATAAMKKDKVGTIAILAQYLLLDPTTDASSLEVAYANLVQTHIEPIPYVTTEGIQADIAVLSSRNPQVATLTPEMVMDMSLVHELEQSGWFEELYE